MSSGGGSGSTKSCLPCRIGKTRCSDPDGTGCQRCRASGIECIKAPAVRFKHDSTQRAFAFSPQQVWVPASGGLQFHDETPDLIYHYHGAVSTDSALHGPPGLPTEIHQLFQISARGRPDFSHESMEGLLTSQTSETVPLSVESAPASSAARVQPSPYTDPDFPTDSSPATHSQAIESPWDPLSWAGDAAQSQPKQLSETEASLLRNFMHNMAPWADGPDPHRSFELEASRIALTDPILRHAICAFSARHAHRNAPDRDTEAIEHQAMCLQLLIPAISGRQSISDGVLAAVAILRQNEEMDEDDDNRFHLEGVTRILNDVSNSASSGGMREATAWLCLREDLYVSLTTQTPIRTNLPPFDSATWIQGDSHWSWANRMVLLLAELLSVVFLDHIDQNALASIRGKISTWSLMKPSSFTPIYFKARHPKGGRFLPEIWMLSAPHAIGLQYYYIAQLTLIVVSGVPSTGPFNHIHEHRMVERQVNNHLLQVVGIAKSNPHAQNTWFTAHHCLAVWGGCLRKQGDREACLSFLKDMGAETGWQIGRLIGRLNAQWEDESE